MYAAALAYQVLFSLFPFAIFLVALLGFLQSPGFFDRIEEQPHVVVPGVAAGLVDQIVGQVVSVPASAPSCELKGVRALSKTRPPGERLGREPSRCSIIYQGTYMLSDKPQRSLIARSALKNCA